MLVLTALALGLRHGLDVDHLAAIADISGAQPARRRALVLSTLYAVGHAAVVLLLGLAAVLVGGRLPPAVDQAMGRVVGVTLVVLGVVALARLARHGTRAELVGRWTLLTSAARRLGRRLGRPLARELVEVEHSHPHDHAPGAEHAHEHEHARVAHLVGAVGAAGAHPHAHRHRHAVPLPDDPTPRYGAAGSVAVGALHGVGAETPTQLLVLATAAGVDGRGTGLLMVVAFVAGLLVSNTAVAAVAGAGLLGPSRGRALLVGVVGLASVGLGAAMLVP